MSQNQIRKGRATAARPSRVLYAQGPPLRSFTKEMGFRQVGAFSANAKKPSGPNGSPEGFQPISSEPAPSPRPWASAPGATPQRTSVEHCRRRARTRIATEAPAPDARASVSTSLLSRSLPKEDLGIPRRPVDRRCGAHAAPAILDVPAWGATPRRSVSDYDKEEQLRAFGYFLT
jgi:hypothetical protein